MVPHNLSRSDKFIISSFRKTLALSVLLLGTCAALALSGCGIGTPAAPPTPVTSALKGHLLGGQQPIVGATVTLYTTGNSGGGNAGYGMGYAQAATATDSNGAFYFPTGSFGCPSGQLLYIASAGGTPTGGSAANPQAVLVAVIGLCDNIFSGGSYTGSDFYMNELSTISAAYAFSGFASDNGMAGASNVIGIGAPATNNAALVSGVSTGCVAGDPVEGGSTTCTATAAAGLYHALLNAQNLVNISPSTPIGGANAAPVGDSSAVVPQQLINSLGNVLVACVNSAGGADPSGVSDASVCGNIFQYTGVGLSTQPTDTFQAMLDLAANPTLNASTANVALLFGQSSSTTNVYTPVLSAAPNDFSMAINYPTALGIKYPNTGALDMNDVFYVANPAGSGTAPVNVLAFSSNGTLLGTSAGNSNLKYAFGLSLDALGHGYFGNGSGSGTNALGVFTAPGGVPSTITNLPINNAANGTTGLLKVYSTAVDLQNNLWVFGQTNSGTILNTLYTCPVGISATSENCVGETSSTGAVSSTGVILAVDPNQNIWTGGTATVAVLPNTGTVAAPVYPTTTISAGTGPNPALGLAFTGLASYPKAYLSGYKTGSPGVQPIGYTQTGVGVATLSPGTTEFGISPNTTATAMSGPYGDFADGNGTVWVADYNGHAVFQTSPNATTPAAYRLIPCIGGATTCGNAFVTGKPTALAIDSAGSIWVTDPAGANVIQIIGSAAPVWPLLSLGKTGKP